MAGFVRSAVNALDRDEPTEGKKVINILIIILHRIHTGNNVSFFFALTSRHSHATAQSE
jgi:hypothetical protein